MKTSSAKTVDEFIAEAPAETRQTIQEIRAIVMSAVPDAEETMGYGKPYYKYHGWMTGVALYTKHLGIEIWDGLSDDDRKELEGLGYRCGSKNFNVTYGQKVPAEILTRLVQAQAKRNETKA